MNDIPLLTTLPVAATFHLVIGVGAAESIRIARLVQRGLDEQDARARMAAQIDDEHRRALCDEWLDNGGDRAAIADAVGRLWSERLAPFAANVAAGRPARRLGPALVQPDWRWSVLATLIAARISAATEGLPVEHIGSTAVPGLPAKDVIDLQLGVQSPRQADDLGQTLTAAGFPRVDRLDRDTPHPRGADPVDWGKRVHQNADPGRSVNLHLRVRDGPGWRWALLFRDWLRADPQVTAEYLAIKQAAMAAHGSDSGVDGYADAKEPWLAAAYEQGSRWAERTGWTPERTAKAP